MPAATLTLPDPLLLIAVFVLAASFRSTIVRAFRVVPRLVYAGLIVMTWVLVTRTHDALIVAALWGVGLPVGGVLGQRIDEARQRGYDAAWDDITTECHRLGVAAPPRPDRDAALE